MGSEESRLQYHGYKYHNDPKFRHGKEYGMGDWAKETFLGTGRKRKKNIAVEKKENLQ